MQANHQTQNKTIIPPTNSKRHWSSAVVTGLVAGLAAGVIVLIPVLILQTARGVPVVPEMQLAASSLMGMAAYAGAAGLILGTVQHFL